MLFLSGLVLSSCTSPPEYETTPQGNQWKLLSFGTQSSKLDSAEIVYIDGVILNTLRHDTLSSFYNLPFKEKNDELWKIITAQYAGDRIEYISTTSDFLRKELPTTDTLIYILRFDRMRTKSQLDDLKYKEFVLLDSLIRTDSIKTDYTEYKGVYLKSLNRADTSKVKNGREIVLAYRGYTSAGRIFDDTDRMEGPLRFIVGNEDQVIKGIEIALEKMHLHEKMRVVIPSWMAFGAKGSAGGHVQPYTTVIYDLEVLEMGK